MTRRGSRLDVTPDTEPDTEPEDRPGVTRYDLACTPRASQAAVDASRSWCADRAVPPRASARIALLAQAATKHGLGLRPRTVALRLRWLDPDRVEVDVRSRGCARLRDAGTRLSDGTSPSSQMFDAACEGWGLRVGVLDTLHWFVVDTRR